MTCTNYTITLPRTRIQVSCDYKPARIARLPAGHSPSAADRQAPWGWDKSKDKRTYPSGATPTAYYTDGNADSSSSGSGSGSWSGSGQNLVSSILNSAAAASNIYQGDYVQQVSLDVGWMGGWVGGCWGLGGARRCVLVQCSVVLCMLCVLWSDL